MASGRLLVSSCQEDLGTLLTGPPTDCNAVDLNQRRADSVPVLVAVANVDFGPIWGSRSLYM
jgi:hypothetical protein